MQLNLIKTYAGVSKLLSISWLIYLQTVVIGNNQIDRFYSPIYLFVFPASLVLIILGHLYLGIVRKERKIVWSSAFPLIVFVLYMASNVR